MSNLMKWTCDNEFKTVERIVWVWDHVFITPWGIYLFVKHIFLLSSTNYTLHILSMYNWRWFQRWAYTQRLRLISWLRKLLASVGIAVTWIYSSMPQRESPRLASFSLRTHVNKRTHGKTLLHVLANARPRHIFKLTQPRTCMWTTVDTRSAQPRRTPRQCMLHSQKRTRCVRACVCACVFTPHA